MSISNRTATITRTVVWDPLVHRVEPLVCDVCGQPGDGLHLCTGGHLAHATCLAPQCIDCKRAFCRLCAAQLAECVVCHRPVCRPSLIQCPTCGRGTCSEHRQLCHAAAGQPATLPEPTLDNLHAPLPPAPQPTQTRPKSGDANSAPNSARSAASKPGQANRRQAAPAPAEKPTLAVKGVRIDVQIYEQELTLVAFVMRSTNRVLATRSFQLTPQGILVRCECEKAPCPANGYFHRPTSPDAITKQIAAQIKALQQEYFIPSKKVSYYESRFGQLQAEKQLVLPTAWHDPARLAEAQRGFDHLARE